MHKEKYVAISDSVHEVYEFLSTGPKGTIRKVVQYVAIEENIYNLQFGDWIEETKTISDDIRSNNEDKEIVLATVAFTVFDFMKYHPAAILFAEGSTPARTRLYQMGISHNLAVIRQGFDIQGYINENWEPFKKGYNYQAFSQKAK